MDFHKKINIKKKVLLMRKYVRIIIKKDNKYLMIKEAKGDYNQWNFPGGKVDGDEEPKLAAVRELKEELNLTETELSPLIDFVYEFNNKGLRHGHYFISKEIDINQLKIMEPEKCDGYCFFKLDEVEKFNLNMPPKILLTLKNQQNTR